ncbi:MAG: hypothetical protein ACLUKO_12335 [Enterocloster bolteae]
MWRKTRSDWIDGGEGEFLAAGAAGSKDRNKADDFKIRMKSSAFHLISGPFLKINI